MKDIFICPRNNVVDLTKKHDVTHIVSITDPHGKRPFFHPTRTIWDNILRLQFEDVIEPTDLHAPTLDHMKQILSWGRKLPADAIVLVHCEAGISRSTAAAFALICQRDGPEKLTEAVKLLLEKRACACPNPIMTRHADMLLGFGGKLFAAAEDVANNQYIRNWSPALQNLVGIKSVRK